MLQIKPSLIKQSKCSARPDILSTLRPELERDHQFHLSLTFQSVCHALRTPHTLFQVRTRHQSHHEWKSHDNTLQNREAGAQHESRWTFTGELEGKGRPGPGPNSPVLTHNTAQQHSTTHYSNTTAQYSTTQQYNNTPQQPSSGEESREKREEGRGDEERRGKDGRRGGEEWREEMRGGERR